jgi:hypothetical protein
MLRARPFDERYRFAAGEDRAWCEQLADAGECLVLVPDARVWHHQDLSWRSFWRQQVRYGRGAHRFHGQRSAGGSWRPGRLQLDLVRAGFERGAAVGALVVLAQVATAVGVAQEAVVARRERRSLGLARARAAVRRSARRRRRR